MKINRKRVLITIVVVFLVSSLTSSFSMVSMAKAPKTSEEDYSFYMKSRELDVKNDDNNLLYENATEDNEFRNKLASNERVGGGNEFSIEQPAAGEKTGYAVNQFYFDNLTEERAWESQESGTEKNGTVSAITGADNYVINNGTEKSSERVASEGNTFVNFSSYSRFGTDYDGYGHFEDNEVNSIHNQYLAPDGANTYYNDTSDFKDFDYYDELTLELKVLVQYDYQDLDVDVYYEENWINVKNFDAVEGAYQTEEIDLTDYLSVDFNVRMRGTTNGGETVYWVNLTATGATKPLESEYTPTYNFSGADFTYTNGTLNNTGDLSEIDGDYTSINSTEGNIESGYPGTYLADGNSVGDTGTSIDFIDYDISSADDYEIKIINGNHKKALLLNDKDTGGYIRTKSEFSEVNGDEVIEFWLAVNDSTQDFLINWRDDYNDIFMLRNLYGGDDLDVRTSSGWSSLYTLKNGVFTHIKIKTDLSAGTLDVYVNNSLILNDMVPNDDMSDGIDLCEIYTDHYDDTAEMKIWIDAVGMPERDANYEEGDNFEEGDFPTLNTTITNQIDIENTLKDGSFLNYALNTSISQQINLSIYNNDLNHYYLINSDRFNFTDNTFDLNSSYYNATNHIKIRIVGVNETNDFQLYIDKLLVSEPSDLTNYKYYQFVSFEFESDLLRSDIIELFYSDFNITLCNLESNVTLDYIDYSDYFNLYYYDSGWEWLNITNWEDSNANNWSDSVPEAAMQDDKLKFKLEIGYWKDFDVGWEQFAVKYRYKTKDNIGFHEIDLTYTNGETEQMEIDIYEDFMFIAFDRMLDREYQFGLQTTESLELQSHFRVDDDGEAFLKLVIYYNQNSSNFEVLNFYDSDFGEHIVFENFTYYSQNPMNESHDGAFQTTYYPLLSGFRDLYTEETTFERFIQIPLYSEAISLYEPDPEPPKEPDEPDKPQGADGYWYYTSYEIIVWNTETLDIGEEQEDPITEAWEFDFNRLHAKSRQEKFWYDLDSVSYVKPKDMGKWGAWNFIRDGLAALVNVFIGIINLILVVVQFFLYFLYVAFNFIIMYLIVGLVFCWIWNEPIKLIYIGILWLGWWICAFLIDVFLLLGPIWEWLIDEVLPWALAMFITATAWVASWVIWALSGGNMSEVQREAIQGEIQVLFSDLMSFIFDNTITIVNNLDVLISAVFLYALVCAMLYEKFIYTRARGYIKRSEQLYKSFTVYVHPFILLGRFFNWLWGILPFT